VTDTEIIQRKVNEIIGNSEITLQAK